MSISFPSADFAPSLSGYAGQGAFRFWCQKVLPIVYDDSLSYYELLNKVVDYLNNTIANLAIVEENVDKLNDSYLDLQNFVNETNSSIETEINEFEDSMTNKYELFKSFVTTTVRELQQYVNSYFDNLDVQQEINNKLDSMASSGALTNLITPLVAESAPGIITDWLDDNITPTSPAIDRTLTISGAAADAKAVGDALSTKMNGAISWVEKTANEVHEGYLWGAGELVENSLYTAYKYNVNAGARIKVIGVQPSSTYLLYKIYDSSNTMIESSILPVETGRGKKTHELTVPENGAYMWINTMTEYSDSGGYDESYVIDPEEFIRPYSDALNTKMNGFAYWGLQQPVETHAGYLWGRGELVANSLYTAYKYNVNAGDNIKVVGIQPSSTYLLYKIYGSSNNMIDSSILTVETGTGKKTYEFTVPENGTYMWINTMNNYSDSGCYGNAYNTDPISLLNNVRIRVIVTENGATFETRSGFQFIIRKVGANNIVNIYAGYYNGDILFATRTDWIGPYQFTKDSDAHGDLERATTGGNHNITDGTQTAVTARTISLSIVGDGNVLEPGEHWVDNASIQWINEVMAGNTCKYDGTGEYCLEEHCCITVLNNGTLDVKHWFKPYYDCTLQWYSGMQFAGQGFAPNIYIPEYKNSYMQTGEINTNSNLCEVDKITAVGDDVTLEMFLDRNYGLGVHTLKQQVTGNDSKAYFVLQSYYDEPMTIKANEIYSWHGSYRFFKSY